MFKKKFTKGKKAAIAIIAASMVLPIVPLATGVYAEEIQYKKVFTSAYGGIGDIKITESGYYLVKPNTKIIASKGNAAIDIGKDLDVTLVFEGDTDIIGYSAANGSLEAATPAIKLGENTKLTIEKQKAGFPTDGKISITGGNGYKAVYHKAGAGGAAGIGTEGALAKKGYGATSQDAYGEKGLDAQDFPVGATVTIDEKFKDSSQLEIKGGQGGQAASGQKGYDTYYEHKGVKGADVYGGAGGAGGGGAGGDGAAIGTGGGSGGNGGQGGHSEIAAGVSAKGYATSSGGGGGGQGVAGKANGGGGGAGGTAFYYNSTLGIDNWTKRDSFAPGEGGAPGYDGKYETVTKIQGKILLDSYWLNTGTGGKSSGAGGTGGSCSADSNQRGYDGGSGGAAGKAAVSVTPTYRNLSRYTVKWLDDDDSLLEEDKDVLHGETPEYNGPTPTKDSTKEFRYVFSGWNLIEPTIMINSTYKVIADTIFKAMYEEVTNGYTLVWEDYEGTELKRAEGPYNTPYSGPTPTRASTDEFSYEFTGWEEKNTLLSDVITYTAQYKETRNKYYVTFVNDDGKELYKVEVPYGETPEYKGEKPSKSATKEFSYEFEGWNTAVSPVTGDVTYTAQYKEIKNDGQTNGADGQISDGRTNGADGQISDGQTKGADAQISDGRTKGTDGQVSDGETKGTNGQVDTGDKSNLILWILLLLVASSIATITIIKKKKSKSKI